MAEKEVLLHKIDDLNETIKVLRQETKILRDHILKMSCCCSGCGKHNLDLVEKENNGLFE